MKQIVIIIFLSIQLITLFAQKGDDISFYVEKIDSKFIIDGRQTFYALPKNSITVEVYVEKIIQYEGPYSTFAPKYLNITEGIIPMDSETHRIVSVEFNRTSHADSSQFYAINYNGYESLPMLQLNSNGVIVGCNLTTPAESDLSFNNPMVIKDNDAEEFCFFDLGTKSFLVENENTFYKTVETDSTPQRVAYKKIELEATTTEENAKMAAAFIRKIRKRRVKLIMGINDEVVSVDGKAIKAMVAELDKYEQMYLELFVGKSIKKTNVYYFDFEPTAGKIVQNKTVGWFSKTMGITVSKPSKKRDYKPLVMTVKQIGNVMQREVKRVDDSQKDPIAIEYGLYYRIPGWVDITFEYANKIIAQQKWEIAQMGVTLPLPIDYLYNHKYSIEFYPETGALKGISLNKLE